MFMRTKRLFLRPIWPEDWINISSGTGDEAAVRNFASRPRSRRLPLLVVTHPEGEDCASVIGMVGLSGDDGQANFGCWIARSHRGNGYATEAAQGLINLARVLGHRRIFAWHFTENPASGCVLHKLGFRETGMQTEMPTHGSAAHAIALVLALDLGVGHGCDCALGRRPGVAMDSCYASCPDDQKNVMVNRNAIHDSKEEKPVRIME